MTSPSERSNWPRKFLQTIKKLDVSLLNKYSGLRIGLFVITPLFIGLIVHHVSEAVFATLGTMNVIMVEGRRPDWATDEILVLVSIIYASVFTIGILISTTGPLLISLYALGLLMISYIGVYPRAVNIDGSMQTEKDWQVVETAVGNGVSIGTGAIILCGVTIGDGATIGAGAVVTKSVPSNAVVAGVPARLIARQSNGERDDA